MNIRMAIEAGHYPKDSRGRAVVRMRNDERGALIYATDHPGPWPIVGAMGDCEIVDQWRADGRFSGSGESDFDLMPPPPLGQAHEQETA